LMTPEPRSIVLSDSAAAAASELISTFLSNPAQPLTRNQFLTIEQKYNLGPSDAYQLLLHQI
jgi:hypothetical protein